METRDQEGWDAREDIENETSWEERERKEIAEEDCIFIWPQLAKSYKSTHT